MTNKPTNSCENYFYKDNKQLNHKITNVDWH